MNALRTLAYIALILLLAWPVALALCLLALAVGPRDDIDHH